MKNIIKLLGIVVTIGFLAFSCLTYEPINTSLEGVWNRGDIVITITGNMAVFSQISPNTNWDRVQNNGQIKIGDVKFRNITQTGRLTWTCQDLTFNHDVWTIRGWENATITMNSNGQTIQISTGGGITNPNTAYTRVR